MFEFKLDFELIVSQSSSKYISFDFNKILQVRWCLWNDLEFTCLTKNFQI